MKTWNSALLIGAMLAAGGIASAKDYVSRDDRGRILVSEAPDQKVAAKDRAAAPKHPPLNACGCYAKDNACVCTTRVMKCDCPGECEPVGCEAKRQKQIERELAEETKRIQEENRKRDEAEKAKQAALLAPKQDEEDDNATEEEEVKPAKGKVKGKGGKSAEKPADKGEGKTEKSDGKAEKTKPGAPAEQTAAKPE